MQGSHIPRAQDPINGGTILALASTVQTKLDINPKGAGKCTVSLIHG